MTQMTLLKGLSSARSKTVCEIRIADKKRTEKLSKISLRRQSKFTKSERLCSINVVLSYWLERPGKVNFHQSFNAVDRETFRRDKTQTWISLYWEDLLSYCLRRFSAIKFKSVSVWNKRINLWLQVKYSILCMNNVVFLCFLFINPGFCLQFCQSIPWHTLRQTWLFLL